MPRRGLPCRRTQHRGQQAGQLTPKLDVSVPRLPWLLMVIEPAMLSCCTPPHQLKVSSFHGRGSSDDLAQKGGSATRCRGLTGKAQFMVVSCVFPVISSPVPQAAERGEGVLVHAGQRIPR